MENILPYCTNAVKSEERYFFLCCILISKQRLDKRWKERRGTDSVSTSEAISSSTRRRRISSYNDEKWMPKQWKK
jgi:hypothetical protein